MKFCLRPHRRSIRIRLDKANETLAKSYDRLNRIDDELETPGLTLGQLELIEKKKAHVSAGIEKLRNDIAFYDKSLAALPKNWFELFRKYLVITVSTLLIFAGILIGMINPENTDLPIFYSLLGAAGLGINGIYNLLQMRKKEDSEEKDSRLESGVSVTELAA